MPKSSTQKSEKEAQGTEVYTGPLAWGETSFTLATVTAAIISKYEYSVILADPVKNLKRIMFRGAPVYRVLDENGEEEKDLSKTAAWLGTKLKLFTKAQWIFHDSIFGGCSVNSIGWDTVDVPFRGQTVEMYAPTEIRHLPWNSFADSPSGYLETFNPVMLGIVIDKTDMHPRAFQSVDMSFIQNKSKTGTLKAANQIEIPDPAIIKNPATPEPAGSAECLPLIPLIKAFDYADRAWNQKINRVGAPPIFPYVKQLTAAKKTYLEGAVKKWGKDTGFLLYDDMDFKNAQINESRTAEERLKWLKFLCDSYFNPTTPLKDTGVAIGRSDSGASELLNGYINTTLAWIEDGLEREIFVPWLDELGFGGYTPEIMFPRASSRNDQQLVTELDLLAKYGALTRNELREYVPNLNMKPSEDPVFSQPIQNPAPPPVFGGMPVGALAHVGNVGKLNVQRLAAYQQTRKELQAANRRMAERIKEQLIEEEEE